MNHKQPPSEMLRELTHIKLGFNPEELEKKHVMSLNNEKMMQVAQCITLLIIICIACFAVMRGIMTRSIDSVVLICGVLIALFTLLLRWFQLKELDAMLCKQDTKDLNLWSRIRHLFSKVQDLFTDETDTHPLEKQVEAMVRFHFAQLRGDFSEDPGKFLTPVTTIEQQTDSRNRLRYLVELVIHLKLMSSEKIQIEKSGNIDKDTKVISRIIYMTLFKDPWAELS